MTTLYTVNSTGVVSERLGCKIDGPRATGTDESGWLFSFTIGRDAFLTEAEALTAAQAAIDKRLVSLRKQIATLEATVPTVRRAGEKA